MKKMNRKEAPLVSIVTPSYNQGSFIEETIKSVLSQDYPNIEYIVVDGGSTDNTVEILKKYESRLKWVSEEDEGQSDAVNKGFGMAKGEIFAWLNSDDTYLPGAVSKVVDFFSCHRSIELVYGKSYYINIKGEIVGNYPTETFDVRKLATFNFIAQPSVFFRRIAWDEIGGLDLDLSYCLDYDLWIRMAQKNKFDYIEEYLSAYRIHREAKTVSEHNAITLHGEILTTVMKHYKWAPLNRVYGYCYHSVKSKLPSFVSKMSLPLILLTMLASSVKYISLNRRIRFEDVMMMNISNFRKLSNGWEAKDILK